MVLPRLTQMRRSVWSAIDNWPAFEHTFAHKFRLEGRGQLTPTDFVPAEKDLTCIAIEPGAVETPMVANQIDRIGYSLNVSVWTSWRSVLEGEWIWEEWQKAIWQQGPPEGGGTFLEHNDHGNTVIHSVSSPATSQVHDVLGEPIMMVWRWSVTLRHDWNPRTDTAELEKPEAN